MPRTPENPLRQQPASPGKLISPWKSKASGSWALAYALLARRAGAGALRRAPSPPAAPRPAPALLHSACLGLPGGLKPEAHARLSPQVLLPRSTLLLLSPGRSGVFLSGLLSRRGLRRVASRAAPYQCANPFPCRQAGPGAVWLEHEPHLCGQAAFGWHQTTGFRFLLISMSQH